MTLLVLSACGAEGDGARLDDHLAAATMDCGTLDFRALTGDGDFCPAGRAAAIECMEAALAECEPARLVALNLTDEGAATADYYFVVERAGACGVAWFYDGREDSWGPGVVESFACAGVGWSGPTVSGCEFAVATGCSPE
jgi:hypothetical protein